MTFSANGISILADLEGVSLGAIGLSLCVGTEGTDSAARTGGTTVNFMGTHDKLLRVSRPSRERRFRVHLSTVPASIRLRFRRLVAIDPLLRGDRMDFRTRLREICVFHFNE